jgi:protein-S-isoprenylcysteine O-methyltransferase Ste14
MKYIRGIGFALNTLLMYLGISLLGWGLGDIQGFFQSSPRLAYALLIAILGLAVGIQSIDNPEGVRGRSGEKGKRLNRQRIVRITLTLALFVALFFLPFADRRNIGVLADIPLIRWSGTVLTGVGLGFIFWSGLALGKMYSGDVTIQENHKLITTGLYHYIRHPRYLGALLFGLGFALLFRSWIGLIAEGLLLGVIYFRICDEENVMYKEFGKTWEEYCNHSWRLIPYIY